MLNSYETQRAWKTNKGHCFAAKKNVSIVIIRFKLADTFFLIRMAILSNFHMQNLGYLQGRLLCNMIWQGTCVFIFFKWKDGPFEICLFLCTKINNKGRKQ